ncbi:hypothetical protein VTH06DRAFT_6658 [Thermothelomyces fergusii]
MAIHSSATFWNDFDCHSLASGSAGRNASSGRARVLNGKRRLDGRWRSRHTYPGAPERGTTHVDV